MIIKDPFLCNLSHLLDKEVERRVDENPARDAEIIKKEVAEQYSNALFSLASRLIVDCRRFGRLS